MMKINLSPIELGSDTPIKEYIIGMALGALISIILGAIVLMWLSLS